MWDDDPDDRWGRIALAIFLLLLAAMLLPFLLRSP